MKKMVLVVTDQLAMLLAIASDVYVAIPEKNAVSDVDDENSEVFFRLQSHPTRRILAWNVI